ncbi:unnamed protein product, partial [Prorocentrum cordatum]
ATLALGVRVVRRSEMSRKLSQVLGDADADEDLKEDLTPRVGEALVRATRVEDEEGQLQETLGLEAWQTNWDDVHARLKKMSLPNLDFILQPCSMKPAPGSGIVGRVDLAVEYLKGVAKETRATIREEERVERLRREAEAAKANRELWGSLRIQSWFRAWVPRQAFLDHMRATANARRARKQAEEIARKWQRVGPPPDSAVVWLHDRGESAATYNLMAAPRRARRRLLPLGVAPRPALAQRRAAVVRDPGAARLRRGARRARPAEAGGAGRGGRERRGEGARGASVPGGPRRTNTRAWVRNPRRSEQVVPPRSRVGAMAARGQGWGALAGDGDAADSQRGAFVRAVLPPPSPLPPEQEYVVSVVTDAASRENDRSCRNGGRGFVKCGRSVATLSCC